MTTKQRRWNDDVEQQIQKLMEQSDLVETLDNELISIVDDAFDSGVHLWYDDDCPYDSSGDVCDVALCDCIDDITTLNDLLHTYTGQWRATFCSGMGKHFITLGEQWGDALQGALLQAVRGHYEDVTGIDVDDADDQDQSQIHEFAMIWLDSWETHNAEMHFNQRREALLGEIAVNESTGEPDSDYGSDEGFLQRLASDYLPPTVDWQRGGF